MKHRVMEQLFSKTMCLNLCPAAELHYFIQVRLPRLVCYLLIGSTHLNVILCFAQSWSIYMDCHALCMLRVSIERQNKENKK